MDRRGKNTLISSDWFPSNPNAISPAAGVLRGIKELLAFECDSTQSKHFLNILIYIYEYIKNYLK